MVIFLEIAKSCDCKFIPTFFLSKFSILWQFLTKNILLFLRENRKFVLFSIRVGLPLHGNVVTIAKAKAISCSIVIYSFRSFQCAKMFTGTTVTYKKSEEPSPLSHTVVWFLENRIFRTNKFIYRIVLYSRSKIV